MRAEVSIRSAALAAFQLEQEEVSSDLVISVAAAAAKGWAGHQEQPVDQNASAMYLMTLLVSMTAKSIVLLPIKMIVAMVHMMTLTLSRRFQKCATSTPCSTMPTTLFPPHSPLAKLTLPLKIWGPNAWMDSLQDT